MTRRLADLSMAAAGMTAWLLIVAPVRLVKVMRTTDREALGLSLVAWLLLMLGLVVLFPGGR